jgi:hypothetical protein
LQCGEGRMEMRAREKTGFVLGLSAFTAILEDRSRNLPTLILRGRGGLLACECFRQRCVSPVTRRSTAVVALGMCAVGSEGRRGSEEQALSGCRAGESE